MKDEAVTIVEQHVKFTLALTPRQAPRLRQHDLKYVAWTLHITLKLLRDVPAQRNSPRVKTARRDMAEWLLANGQTEKIFIDESGFRL